MKAGSRSSNQQGVALAIVLMLLLILTILVTAGAGTATAELVMAGNEQYLKRAADAASAGVEETVAAMTTGSVAVSLGPARFGDSDTDFYTATLQYIGADAPAGYSVGKFIAKHYVIESTGHASRGATDIQIQGMEFIAVAAGVDEITGSGMGLEGNAPP